MGEVEETESPSEDAVDPRLDIRGGESLDHGEVFSLLHMEGHGLRIVTGDSETVLELVLVSTLRPKHVDSSSLESVGDLGLDGRVLTLVTS